MSTVLNSIPVLPLRDVVVYPGVVLPLFVGREKSISALRYAEDHDKKVLLLTQKDPNTDDPVVTDLYDVGTLVSILELVNLPDGTLKVLVEGVNRTRLMALDTEGEFYKADIKLVEESDDGFEGAKTYKAALEESMRDYLLIHKRPTDDLAKFFSESDSASKFVDLVANHLPMSVESKQRILDLFDVQKRYEALLKIIETETDEAKLEKRIRGRVRDQMEKGQREYYLNEQMKAIQKELGDMNEGKDELNELQAKIEEANLSEEARQKVDAEFKKLKMMSPMSAEAGVIRNYIDTLINLPWGRKSRVKSDLHKAQDLLDEQHYGLEKVKERILEYLAVQKRVKKSLGPILCLVGPPGVGKTSLGQSIAQATGRKFTRMALGGVRDEAEMRGHRRTYIGAMPGKIIQNLSKVGSNNPVFLLDEVDKMSTDFRGDPASALLEILDPSQNKHFNDHYLEVDYDLSDVMFIATSNSMDIPSPLLDRMEIIRISGYTEEEKINIALKHLLPKQMKDNGVKKGELEVHESAVKAIVQFYTREAGVRSLDRQLSKLCRKVVKSMLLDPQETKAIVNADNISDYLGVKPYKYGEIQDDAQIGQVTGLAWTEVGGELLSIESVLLPGKGKLNYTGKLGDVMQESIQAAMTVVRANSDGFGLPSDFYEKHDFHVHVPEGATPKDGPSAGIAMCTSLVSVLTDIPVKADVAMTGEITLRGEVLPIGGLKEKLLAAHRGGVKLALIPAENEKDLEEVPKDILDHIEVVPVRWIDQVLDLALVKSPYTDQSVKKSVMVDQNIKNMSGDVGQSKHH